MEEIIRVENEVILNILESELKKIGVEYLIKKLDISNLPVNTNDYAIIFSENKNRTIINDIYCNIKYSQKIENEKEEKNENTVLKTITKIVIFVILVIIIIIQQIIIQNNNKALTFTGDGYTYKWSSDLHETYIYRKDGYYLQKSIDNDRNNILEKAEVYYPNGMIGIYEDENQNSFYEKYIIQRDNMKLEEGISINDNGIYDKIYYYKDGEINQILIYDIEQNTIRIDE